MRKKTLPFVTTYHPALQNLKNILMSKWHLIQDQPPPREIYNEPPIISYKRAKSLGDILVRAKLWGHISHYHELLSRVWPVNTFHFAIYPMFELELQVTSQCAYYLWVTALSPMGPWELLWLVQAHRPVFGSVKLAPIKYEKSFVPRHLKSDEGLLWKSKVAHFGTLLVNRAFCFKSEEWCHIISVDGGIPALPQIKLTISYI